MLKRILDSIKKGNLGDKVIKNLIILFSPNYSIANAKWRWYTYKNLKRKYKKIIDEFVPNELNHKNSKNIWILWLQGYENAPDLVKCCINSVRRNAKGANVIVLDNENINQYIKFPNYIEKKWNEGKICPAHYSDLIRLELLCKYGGTWLDSTVLCTSNNDCNYVFEENFFVYKQMDLSRQNNNPIVASNWFIHSVSNNNILLLTRKLLHEYWKKHDYPIDYFIFHLFFTIATEKYNQEWEHVPVFNNNSPHTLQFELKNKYENKRWEQILRMSDFHKLNHHDDYSGCHDTYYNYILKEYLD